MAVTEPPHAKGPSVVIAHAMTTPARLLSKPTFVLITVRLRELRSAQQLKTLDETF